MWNFKQAVRYKYIVLMWFFEWCIWTFQEQIEAYKAKKKAIDAAPIKKVAEAKARKKRKVSTVIFLKFWYNSMLYIAVICSSAVRRPLSVTAEKIVLTFQYAGIR